MAPTADWYRSIIFYNSVWHLFFSFFFWFFLFCPFFALRFHRLLYARAFLASGLWYLPCPHALPPSLSPSLFPFFCFFSDFSSLSCCCCLSSSSFLSLSLSTLPLPITSLSSSSFSRGSRNCVFRSFVEAATCFGISQWWYCQSSFDHQKEKKSLQFKVRFLARKFFSVFLSYKHCHLDLHCNHLFPACDLSSSFWFWFMTVMFAPSSLFCFFLFLLQSLYTIVCIFLSLRASSVIRSSSLVFLFSSTSLLFCFAP